MFLFPCIAPRVKLEKDDAIAFPVNLTFVRHGQSEMNVAGMSASNNTSLTPTGHLQSILLGKWFKSIGANFDVAIVSDCLRTQQTFAGIVKGGGIDSNTPVVLSPLFREQQAGALAGLNRVQVSTFLRAHRDLVEETGGDVLSALATSDPSLGIEPSGPFAVRVSHALAAIPALVAPYAANHILVQSCPLASACSPISPPVPPPSPKQHNARSPPPTTPGAASCILPLRVLIVTHGGVIEAATRLLPPLARGVFAATASTAYDGPPQRAAAVAVAAADGVGRTAQPDPSAKTAARVLASLHTADAAPSVFTAAAPAGRFVPSMAVGGAWGTAPQPPPAAVSAAVEAAAAAPLAGANAACLNTAISVFHSWARAPVPHRGASAMLVRVPQAAQRLGSVICAVRCVAFGATPHLDAAAAVVSLFDMPATAASPPGNNDGLEPEDAGSVDAFTDAICTDKCGPLRGCPTPALGRQAVAEMVALMASAEPAVVTAAVRPAVLCVGS